MIANAELKRLLNCSFSLEGGEMATKGMLHAEKQTSVIDGHRKCCREMEIMSY